MLSIPHHYRHLLHCGTGTTALPADTARYYHNIRPSFPLFPVIGRGDERKETVRVVMLCGKFTGFR